MHIGYNYDTSSSSFVFLYYDISLSLLYSFFLMSSGNFYQLPPKHHVARFTILRVKGLSLAFIPFICEVGNRVKLNRKTAVCERSKELTMHLSNKLPHSGRQERVVGIEVAGNSQLKIQTASWLTAFLQLLLVVYIRKDYRS